MATVHKIYARVINKNVEPCWMCPNTTVYEYWAEHLGEGPAPGYKDDLWGPDPPDSPTEWNALDGGLEACSASTSGAFYWSNPFIYDKQHYTDPGAPWDQLPVGHPILRAKGWFAIRVPKCAGENRYLKSGPHILEWRVGPNHTIVIVKVN